VSKIGLFIGATIVGAGATYFLDPERGRSRQAFVRDKFIALGNDLQDDLEVMVRDFQNRSKGMLYEVKGNLNKEGIAKIADRIRGEQGDGQPQAQSETEQTSNGRMAPAVCLITASAGLMMTLTGMLKRSLFGGMMMSTGLAIMAKSFYDVEHRFDPRMETECKRIEEKQRTRSKARKQAEATMQ